MNAIATKSELEYTIWINETKLKALEQLPTPGNGVHIAASFNNTTEAEICRQAIADARRELKIMEE
jgi:hypothetical protein